MRTCIGLIAAKVHDKAMKLHAIASLGVSGTDNQGCTTTTPSHQTGGGNGTLTSSHNGSLQAISNGQLPANGADNGYSPSQQTTVTQLSNGDDLQAENDRTPENRDDKSGPYWDLHASNTNNNADEVVATQVRIVSESIPANTKHSHNFLYNVGPTSSTLGRRCINVMKMLCVRWVSVRGPSLHPKPILPYGLVPYLPLYIFAFYLASTPKIACKFTVTVL